MLHPHDPESDGDFFTSKTPRYLTMTKSFAIISGFRSTRAQYPSTPVGAFPTTQPVPGVIQ
jgi:hypothetical protein